MCQTTVLSVLWRGADVLELLGDFDHRNIARFVRAYLSLIVSILQYILPIRGDQAKLCPSLSATSAIENLTWVSTAAADRMRPRFPNDDTDLAFIQAPVNVNDISEC